MNKWLGSVAIAALFAGSAMAADLPARGPAIAPAPVYVAPIFTWSGFYVGLNAGVAWGSDRDRLRAEALPGAFDEERAFVDDFNTDTRLVRDDGGDTSFTGGAQVGFNWQFGAMVVGIEGDINFKGRSDARNFDALDVGYRADEFGVIDPGYDVAVRSGRSSNWFATIRPRIGFAMDRTLFYVTGGLAYAKSGGSTSVTVFDNFDGSETTFSSRRSGSNWGWTLGGGVEFAFTNNMTAKVEYLYVDLDRGGNRTVVAVGDDLPNVTFRGGAGEDNFHVVRVGLNWKFGGSGYAAGGPVVAAY